MKKLAAKFDSAYYLPFMKDICGRPECEKFLQVIKQAHQGIQHITASLSLKKKSKKPVSQVQLATHIQDYRRHCQSIEVELGAFVRKLKPNKEKDFKKYSEDLRTELKETFQTWLKIQPDFKTVVDRMAHLQDQKDLVKYYKTSEELIKT